MAVLAGPPVAEAQVSSSPLNLSQAISFAVEHSPGFDTSQKQLQIYQLEEKSASARLWPSLDLTATHGLQDTAPRTVSTPWASDFNLALTESLYDNGVTWTQSEIASLNRQRAEYDFLEQKNKLTLDIATQFVLFSLNVKLAELQERQFKLVSKQYESISKSYHQGIKTKNDFLRFKTQVSRSEIDLNNAHAAVDKAKIELRRLVGVGLGKEDLQQIEFAPMILNGVAKEKFNAHVDYENHPLYRAAELQKKANRLNSDLVGRKNLPEWFLSSGVNYASSNYLGTGQSFSDNAQWGWNALLTVKYNFLDWGTRSRDKEVAIQRRDIQNNELDASLLTLKSTLRQMDLNLQQLQKNYDLSQDLLSLERSNIDFIEREYRNGKVQYLDLITGLNNLSDAEYKFYSASADLLTLRYTYLYHQGKLYEELQK